VEESAGTFEIVDYGPADELPAEVKKPAIYVVFSQPVVPLARLGEPLREDGEGKSAGLFTIDPPLAGVYRWYGSRLLSFEPDGESLPQRRYTVTVPENIRSLGGKALEGTRSFSFETERLSVAEWRLGTGEYWSPGNVPPEDAKLVGIIFSYPVNLEEIAGWLEVRAGGRTWPFTLDRLPEIDRGRYRPEQGALLTLGEALPLDTEVTVTLLAGARSEPGWLGTKNAQSYTYHTLLPFRFEEVSVRSYSSPRTEEGDTIPIALRFSQNVEPRGAEKFFSVAGMPALQEENVHVYGSTVILNKLPLEYRKTYTVTISPDLVDLWGRPLGRSEKAEARVGDANSYVYIHNRGSRMLEAAFPPKIVWEARNPVSLKRGIGPAAGPYDRTSGLLGDVPALPENAKRFFMEDLSPYLERGGRGSVGLRWEYETRSSWDPGRVNRGDAWLTVQVTDIGLTVRYAYNRVLVWAARLSTGEPVAEARVELLNGETPVIEGTTDGQGLAVFDFPDGFFVSRFSPPAITPRNTGAAGEGFRLRVREGGGSRNGGDEVEFIPNDSHNLWRFDIAAAAAPFTAEQDRPVIFLFTDRGIYRPGETVSFRGIDRTLSRGQFEAYSGSYSIEVSTGAYQAPVIASIEGEASGNGGSYGSFTLPEGLDPGQYQIRYRRTGTARQPPAPDDRARQVQQIAVFTVANFERLRFEASARIPDLLFYQGEKIAASFSASYLAGGALSGAPYTWYWTREPSGFNPGGPWQNWKFGPELNDGRSFVGRGEGLLGPDGKAEISQDVPADGIEGAAYRYRLEASVQDAARQEIASRAAALVHPGSFYIASRLDPGTIKPAAVFPPAEGGGDPSAYFLSAGKPASVSWALVSPEGEPWRLPEGSAGELTLQLVRYDWKQARQAGVGGRVNLVWERVEEVAEERRFPLEGGGAGQVSGTYTFTPEQSGQWEIRLRSRDQRGRPAATRYRFYVTGAGWVRWGSDDVDTVNLTPDKPRYAPGDTAKILVRTPLQRGKYLLTLEREGIISQRIIELEGSALTIDIPIEESYVPIVYAALSSYTVRTGPPEHTYYEPDLDKPKGIFGVTALHVDHESRHYQVEIGPRKGVYGPGETAEVQVKVTLNGKPAPGTEVSFMAVDRGVVDLIDYHVPDPVAYFYHPRNFPLGVRGADSRSLLIDPVTYSLSDLQGGDDGDPSKLDERKDFRPTAVFEPCLVTGPDGTVTVSFDLPDSLTTYRCTAVAAGLHDFGIREQDLRVSAPLTAVAALPRKLRWRDTGTVSLILTNLENEPVEAEVSLAAENAGAPEGETAAPGPRTPVVEVDGNSALTLRIPAGSAEEARFRVAAVGAGEARLTFTLRSPRVNERIVKTLRVDRPVLYETVTTVGNLGDGDSAVEEGVVLPSLVPEGTGTLSVSLSASRLAMLKEAVGYLLDYPYGCLEQRTARLLPLAAFQEHLDAFGLETRVVNPKKLIGDELAEIAKSQLEDGSFPYWPGGRYGNLMVTLRVAHIAALARAGGISPPPSLDTRKILLYAVSPQAARVFARDPFLKGYSLWIRAMYGERIGGEISGFLKEGDALGVSGWSFAGLAALELGMKDLAVSARDRVRRFIRPGTRTLDLTDTYERRGNFWGYDADRYALALMLYQALSPGDDMTGRLASALIERQRRGVWNNTASSFWAVLAFGNVAGAEAAEWKNSGGFVSRVSLGAEPLLDAEFRSYGGSPASRVAAFAGPPLSALRRDTLLPLRIERQGTGRLYFTASLKYGIPAELAGPRDEGLGVFAETFDSEGRPVRDGRLIPGKTYTRRLTLSSSRDRTYVALRAPVPSGAEIVDAAFVTSSTVPPPAEEPDTDYGDLDWRAGPPRRFVLDDEIRFHWDFFPAGKREVEFRFRAVMPGVYPTPPASAECMYEAEIFGRAGGELIRIGGFIPRP
jgi:uncharacterized protein YfaS (alpha-2-macroglobulin family)